MPISISTPPLAIGFSKNEVPLILSSTDYLAGVPAYSVNYLAFNGAVTANSVYVLAWLTGGVQFTAKDAPDDSGSQFPTGDGSSAYVTSLISYFQANYLLNEYYTISTDLSGSNPKLVFTSIVADPQYNFSASTSVGNSTLGVSNYPKSNFSHYLAVWAIGKPGNADERVLECNLPLDIPYTGDSSIDLSDTLDSWLEIDDIDLVSTALKLTGSIRTFYLKFAQFYGDTPQVKAIQKSSLFYANLGGLSLDLMKRGYTLATYIQPDASRSRYTRCLRTGSFNKPVSIEQPEWLTYINLSGGAISVDLVVSIYYSDNSTVSYKAVTGFAMAAYDKAQFQAGYTQLNVSAQHPDKIVSYYTLQLFNGSNELSALYGYSLDYRYRDWARYFVYWNSLGAWQTLSTIGKGQPEFDKSSDAAEMNTSLQQAALYGNLLETNIRIRDKNTVAIGYDRADSRTTDLLRDFFLSPQIYLYQSGRILPITLATTNLKLTPDGSNAFAASFEYQFAYEDRSWAEDPALSDEKLNASGTPSPSLLVTKKDMIIDNTSSQYKYANSQITITDYQFTLSSKAAVMSSQLNSMLHQDQFTLNTAYPGTLVINHPALLANEYLTITLI